MTIPDITKILNDVTRITEWWDLTIPSKGVPSYFIVERVTEDYSQTIAVISARNEKEFRQLVCHVLEDVKTAFCFEDQFDFESKGNSFRVPELRFTLTDFDTALNLARKYYTDEQ